MPNNTRVSDTAVRIGPVRFFYAYWNEPRERQEGQTPRYTVQIALPKSNAEAKKLIDAAVEAAVEKGVKGKAFAGKRPPNAKLHFPVRDGDAEYPDKPEYAGMWFFNSSNQVKPLVQVYDRSVGARRAPNDTAEFYSGCWGVAQVGFYAYNNSGNMGIAASFDGAIKTRDGERLAGNSITDAAFADIEVDDEDDLDFLD